MRAREDIGRMLREKRKAKGMTQTQVAEKSGLNQANIVKIENGKYNSTIDVLSRFAEAIGCRITAEEANDS